jgi:uncharacterized protein (DUF305 family)
LNVATGADERTLSQKILTPSVRRWALPVAAVVILALAIGWVIGLYGDAQMPENDSAEAGFARDMSVHHTQAVEMSLTVRDRTDDDQIRALATDIMLTQQNQIGQMEGWLGVWELPLAGDEPAMAWMGHEVDGLMPGMATQDEVAALATMPVDEMNVQFLNLMIVHHQAGVEMAEAILERTDRPEIVRLAESIVRTQQSEIDLMNSILDRLGAPSDQTTPAATPSPSLEHEG